MVRFESGVEQSYRVMHGESDDDDDGDHASCQVKTTCATKMSIFSISRQRLETTSGSRNSNRKWKVSKYSSSKELLN